MSRPSRDPRLKARNKKQNTQLIGGTMTGVGALLLFLGIIALLQAIAGSYTIPATYAVILWTVTTSLNQVLAITFLLFGGFSLIMGLYLLMKDMKF